MPRGTAYGRASGRYAGGYEREIDRRRNVQIIALTRGCGEITGPGGGPKIGSGAMGAEVAGRIPGWRGRGTVRPGNQEIEAQSDRLPSTSTTARPGPPGTNAAPSTARRASARESPFRVRPVPSRVSPVPLSSDPRGRRGKGGGSGIQSGGGIRDETDPRSIQGRNQNELGLPRPSSASETDPAISPQSM